MNLRPTAFSDLGEAGRQKGRAKYGHGWRVHSAILLLLLNLGPATEKWMTSISPPKPRLIVPIVSREGVGPGESENIKFTYKKALLGLVFFSITASKSSSKKNLINLSIFN